MSKYLLSVGLALVVLATFTAVAQADAYVELVPTPLGPYFGGEDVHIDVWVSADTGAEELVRYFQLSFLANDPQLEVTGFAFDYSSLIAGDAYTAYPDLPLPAAAYTLLGPVPGYIWTLPADGSALCMAQFEVALPATVGEDPLILDVMNYTPEAGDFSANISTGFPPDSTDWMAMDGTMHGGQLDFSTYVPEPGSLVLLAGGAFLALARRRDGRV